MELLNYRIYSESGTISGKKPVMVLIHGLGGGYANWVFQVRYLKDQYDLLLIELPSHGRSKVKMSQLDLTTGAVSEKVMELLDELNIEKAFFAGLSLGSLITKDIVLHYPERVEKYILIGPIGKFTLLLKFVIRLAMFLLLFAPLNFVVKLACLIIMPHKSLAYGRNLFMACAQRVERKEFIAWGKVLLSFDKIQDRYMKELKDEPDGLYILGAKDYLFLTLLRKEMKRVKNFVVIKDAGHVCNIDRYQTVNELMVQFLEADAAVLETV